MNLPDLDDQPGNIAMDAMVSALKSAFPDLDVSRSFKPMAERTLQELNRGIISLIRLAEDDFANYMGREAELGTVKALLIIQFRAAENSPGADIEKIEVWLAERVKAFLKGPFPEPITGCLANGYKQSGQLEKPFGWVIFELEINTW